MRVVDLEAIRIKLASPEDILSWSHGEVTKPETINYRTQRAEKDGLFDERIFGPEKDYECYCGKYRKIRYKGIICDRCGVEVTKSSVRRERMGHLKLATPCSHIWFLRGVPSRMGLLLDIPAQGLEKVIYFVAYIITSVNEAARQKALDEIDVEWKQRSKGKEGEEKNKLKEARDRARQEVQSLAPLRIIGEMEYQTLALKYGQVFEAGTGSETLRALFERIDLKKRAKELEGNLDKATPQNRKKLLVRLRLCQGILQAGVRPEWMFLTVFYFLMTNFVAVFIYFIFAEMETGRRGWKQVADVLVLMVVGIGLSINGTKAIFEALCKKKTQFIRTPKYSAVGTNDEKWYLRKYFTKTDKTSFVELLMAVYFTWCAYLVFVSGNIYFVLPLLIFGPGYFYLTYQFVRSKGLIKKAAVQLQ